MWPGEQWGNFLLGPTAQGSFATTSLRSLDFCTCPRVHPPLPRRRFWPERFIPVPVYAATDGWKSEHVVKCFQIQNCFWGERLILSGIQGKGKATWSLDRNLLAIGTLQLEDLGTRLRLKRKIISFNINICVNFSCKVNWLKNISKFIVKVVQSCLTVCDPMDLYSPWNSPGQNTGVGKHSLLQEIFPTQGSNPGLPHCRQILYQMSHKVDQEYWSG